MGYEKLEKSQLSIKKKAINKCEPFDIIDVEITRKKKYFKGAIITTIQEVRVSMLPMNEKIKSLNKEIEDPNRNYITKKIQ